MIPRPFTRAPEVVIPSASGIEIVSDAQQDGRDDLAGDRRPALVGDPVPAIHGATADARCGGPETVKARPAGGLGDRGDERPAADPYWAPLHQTSRRCDHSNASDRWLLATAARAPDSPRIGALHNRLNDLRRSPGRPLEIVARTTFLGRKQPKTRRHLLAV